MNMKKKIKVRISKEDIYDVKELINEIARDPKKAFILCDLYGCEGFGYESFLKFNLLTKEEQERLVEDFATSKSEVDAELSANQEDKFDTFPEFFEVEQ